MTIAEPIQKTVVNYLESTGNTRAIELGGKTYDITSSLSRAPSASIAIYQLPGTNASNAATVFIVMDSWEERSDPSLSQEAILANRQRQSFQIQEAIDFAFRSPAINGLGNTGGFQMQLQDRGGIGLEELQKNERFLM